MMSTMTTANDRFFSYQNPLCLY